MTAVVIEDDMDIRGLVQAILISAGLKVQVAATGAAGVEAVLEHDPDVIVVDFGLPDFTGIEAIQRIRNFSRVPVLMLTAREDLADRPYAAGANDVMTKPFNPPELRRRVADLLKDYQHTTATDAALD